MRSWTIFLVFGVLALGVIVYSLVTSYSQAVSPAVQTTQTFLQAIANNDLNTLHRVTDPAIVTVTNAGNKVAGINFKSFHPVDAAFFNLDARSLSYVDLVKLKVTPGAQPVLSGDKDKLASVQLTDNSKVLLHEVKGEWKVIYITEPKEPAK